MEKELGKIKLDSANKLVLECPMVECGKWRLYYDARIDDDGESGYGFEAIAVNFGACPGDSEPFGPDTTIGDYIKITAFFDGVRHLQINRSEKGMSGYLYYPEDLSLIFNELNKLSKKYCLEKQWSRI